MKIPFKLNDHKYIYMGILIEETEHDWIVALDHTIDLSDNSIRLDHDSRRNVALPYSKNYNRGVHSIVTIGDEVTYL